MNVVKVEWPIVSNHLLCVELSRSILSNFLFASATA
jgi:hypothetical protein